MIHDEVDPVIDFTWFYFIGRTKLGLTFKETGRLTLTIFNKFYQHYKDNWDLEMLMTVSRKTYKDVREKQQQSEEWF